jgi:hypothetical protein
MEMCRRGWYDGASDDFSSKALTTMHEAADDVVWLLNRGYGMQSAVNFVGNHYLLTEHQRIALKRAVTSDIKRDNRKQREVDILTENIFIDGFNIIITLETALSGSPVLASRDGVIRDLAGLHGTYRIIDKTEQAVRLIFEHTAAAGAVSVHVLLDRQISNSGRLKKFIDSAAEKLDFAADAVLSDCVDAELEYKNCVITADSVVLDRCQNWYNLTSRIIRNKIPDAWIVNI